METEMMRISNQSRKYAKVENLMCRVSAQTLMQQHKKQKAKKAVGVDHVDKAKYDENVAENISGLVRRMKHFQYKPLPVRRSYIDKGNGKQRPLGIPAYEDRLVQGAMANGVYLYSYAGTEVQAKSELAHILRLIKGHTFELPIFIDVEESNLCTFAPRACRVVCEGLKKAGYIAGVYSSLSWWNSYLTEIKEYIRWVAHWNPTCGYMGDYLIWQYGTEKIDGINGEVDANYYYGDFGTKTNTATTPISTKPDIIYQVYTDASGWLPVVKNLEDYAGVDGQPIKGIRVYVNGVQLDITTHQMSNGSIDKLTITSQDHTIKYRVRTIGSKNYLSWMENKKDTGGSSDTFAGEPGKSIDRVQITI